MAKKIAFQIWTTIISAFALVSSYIPAYGSNIQPRTPTAKALCSDDIKQSDKPLLFLQRAQTAGSADFMIAAHRSHSSHRSHASHRSGYSTPVPETPSESPVAPVTPQTISPRTSTNTTSPSGGANLIVPGKTAYEVLGVGQRGPSVETLQRLLKIHGYPCEPTGIFDFETLRHVTAFQKANRLGSDGIVGESTWKALQKVK